MPRLDAKKHFWLSGGLMIAVFVVGTYSSFGLDRVHMSEMLYDWLFFGLVAGAALAVRAAFNAWIPATCVKCDGPAYREGGTQVVVYVCRTCGNRHDTGWNDWTRGGSSEP